MNPTVINIPHTLGRIEARRRMAERVGDLPSRIPGGMATVTHSWPSVDTMLVDVAVLGQQVAARLDVADTEVRVTLQFPPGLSFLSGTIAAVVRERGENFLIEDKSRA